MRYNTFYFELLKGLKEKHRKLYDTFLAGDFVVKSNKGSFNAVAADLKLEQTIQRSAKSSKGIIGQSKAVDFVTEWALIYHEVLDIANVFRSVTAGDLGGNTETKLSHHLNKTKIKEINSQVDSLVRFMRSQDNPYIIDQNGTKLKNVITQIYVNRNIAEARLNFFSNTAKEFDEFQKNVYVKKTNLLSDKITKFRLLPLDYCVDTKSSETKDVKRSEKQ